MVFGVVTTLLGSLDAHTRHAPPGTLSDAELAGLHGELDRASRYLERSMARQAQLEYFAGMLTGWAAVLGAFAAFAATVALAGGIGLVDEPLVLSAVAGGIGAVVSVMQRMTCGRLQLVPEDGKRTIRILGAIRPVLGAILGSVLCVLLGGGLLPFAQAPASSGDAQYYLVALAFVAGFSERFAQDMITGAAGPAQRPTTVPGGRP